MVDPGILNGLAGGLVATTVMTVFMMALGDDSPPPTASLWSKYVGDGPAEDHMLQGMVLHMLYGIGAGAVLALAIPVLGSSVSLVTAVGIGVGYGIGLTVVGAILWMKVVLAMDPEPATVGMFTLFHLIYGVVLGAFLGVGPL